MIFLVGFLVGTVLGLTGSGGTVIAVPLLVAVLHMDMTGATGMSLGIVALTALAGILQSSCSRRHWIMALPVAAGGVTLSPMGVTLSAYFTEAQLTFGFCLIMAAAIVPMLRRLDTPASSSELPVTLSLQPRTWLGLAGGGAAVGLLSGVFGVGGGFILVPLLIRKLNIGLRQATLVSLMVITAISSIGFGAYLIQTPSFDYESFLVILAGGVAGVSLGRKLGLRISEEVLNQLFVLIVVLLGALMLVTRSL